MSTTAANPGTTQRRPSHPKAGGATPQATMGPNMGRQPSSNVGAVLTSAPPKPASGTAPQQQRPPTGVPGRTATPMPGQRPATGVPKPPVKTTRPATAAPTATTRPPAATKDRRPATQARPGRQSNRRAHLRITRLDLLSILKMAFLFAFCAGIVIFIALMMLWGVLTSTGVVENLQNLLNSVMGNPNTPTVINLSQYLSSQRVVGFITAVTVLNIFVLTLLGTVFGMLYNLAATMFGGLEVTLEV